jgi:hypothetical protein
MNGLPDIIRLSTVGRGGFDSLFGSPHIARQNCDGLHTARLLAIFPRPNASSSAVSDSFDRLSKARTGRWEFAWHHAGAVTLRADRVTGVMHSTD